MTKIQMTLTLEPIHVEYIKRYAGELYEGNESMAIRDVIKFHMFESEWKPLYQKHN